MSVNKVILVGRLGVDPEARATPTGLQVCNLRIATNHVSYDRDGKKNESTEWHRVVFFGRQAEVCEQYLRKGSLVPNLYQLIMFGSPSGTLAMAVLVIIPATYRQVLVDRIRRQ